METRLPPPLIEGLALACVVLLWKFASNLQLNIPFSLGLSIGVILCLAGVFIALSALGLFKRNKTTVMPFKPEKTSALVTSGIYSLSRNPMYLGMSCVILGVIFMLRQPLGIMALGAAAAYLTKFQIIPEERALEASFGEAYLQYKTRVRRWI